MYQEILSDKQLGLLPIIEEFSPDFGLAGGTAIALHIGHRQSIDFDLMSFKGFNILNIQKKIIKLKKIERVFVDEKEEYTISVDGVKITFLQYPFKFSFNEDFNGIKVADLLTLSALKAYAIGRRAKWKDYVDIYFITKSFFNISQISAKAEEIFGEMFNEKIFRSQLSYFNDVDYSEKVEYMPGFEVSDEAIKEKLSEVSLQ
jgi:hypothetical protein